MRTIDSKRSAAERLRRERGQVLVLAALMLTALLLFTGFAIDVGIIYDARRDLVRVADAAALAGAGALSSGAPGQANDWVRQQRAVARVREYVELNGFDPDEAGNTLDVAVTFEGGKFVTVNATRTVPTVFMRLIGIDSVPVSASGEGRVAEAAPVDIVLVQDVSGSQCYTNMPEGQECARIHRYPPDGGEYVDKAYNPLAETVRNRPDRWVNYGTSYSPNWKPGCDPDGNDVWTKCPYNDWTRTEINEPWEPFSTQQDAARYFVSQLDDRYDQVALVSFSSNPPSGSVYGTYFNSKLWGSGLTNSFGVVAGLIGSSPLGDRDGSVGDPGLYPGGSTNMAKGIWQGVEVLTSTSYGARPLAVPVMILLSDGAPTTQYSGVTESGCDLQTAAGCDQARRDTIAQAQIASDRGVIIYTIFVGTPAFADTQAMMLQYIADLTDNHRLEGEYGTLVMDGGPAYDATEFQETISENYFLASTPEELERAYDRILQMIYTRLVR